MKKTLYLSLVAIILTNGNIQNAYGSSQVGRPESLAFSVRKVAPSTQAVTPPTKRQIQRLRKDCIAPLQTRCWDMSRHLSLGETSARYAVNNYFGDHLVDVFVALPPKQPTIFRGLLR